MIIVSVEYLATLWRYTSRTPSLGINEFYPQTILVIGYGLILLRLLQVYFDWWRDGQRDIPGMRTKTPPRRSSCDQPHRPRRSLHGADRHRHALFAAVGLTTFLALFLIDIPYTLMAQTGYTSLTAVSAAHHPAVRAGRPAYGSRRAWATV